MINFLNLKQMDFSTFSISNFFMQSVLDLIRLFFSWLPSPSVLPGYINDNLTGFFTYLVKLDYFFPIDTILIILNFILIIETYVLFTKIVLFLLKAIRGFG